MGFDFVLVGALGLTDFSSFAALSTPLEGLEEPPLLFAFSAVLFELVSFFAGFALGVSSGFGFGVLDFLAATGAVSSVAAS